jgi:transcriptional regulator with XRE-family HTH domain
MGAEWFACRLRELREQAGLTQPQLAERVGRTTRQISRLETGVQMATWETVLALAEALGVTTEAFNMPPTASGDTPRPRGRPKQTAAPPGRDSAASPGLYMPPQQCKKPQRRKTRRPKG